MSSILNRMLCQFGLALLLMAASGQATAQTTYENPVFEPVLADPTVARDPESGDFFAFGTADDFSDGKGRRMVPVLRSPDLVNWTEIDPAMTEKPGWKTKGGIWAPDVNPVGKKFYMYYAFSTWGDPDPGVGLAIADKISGPYVDQGKVFLSSEVDVPNSIDPCLVQDNGKKFLFWGSFSDRPTQGTFAVELHANGKKALDLKKKVKIAAGDWEAVMIHKKGDYYYFIGSKGSCCEGIKSTYRLVVGRSKNVLGPYLDKDDKPITERGNGSLLLEKNRRFSGVGHNSQVITDDAGEDWLLYHGFDNDQPGKLPNGTNRRVLLLDRLTWKDGWPQIEGQSASASSKPAPVFNSLR